MNSRGSSTVPVNWHYWGAFLRVLAFNFALLFSQTTFISQLGAESYSQIFFVCSFLSVGIYLSFLYLSDRQINKFYLGLVLISVLVTIPFAIGKSPPALITLFWVVFIMLSDLSGKNVLSANLQLSTHPAIFRDALNKMVSYELAARILSSAIFLLSSRLLNTQVFAIIFVIVGLIHYFLYFKTHRKTIYPASSLIETSKPIREISKAANFLVTHSLLKQILLIIIWAYLAKFLVEYVFYMETQNYFKSFANIGSILALSSLVSLIITFLTQQYVSRQLAKTQRLSTLLIIMPAAILSISLLFILPLGLIPAILLQTVFIILNKSIHRPMTRECFSVVPSNLRKNVVFLLPVLLSIAGAVLSFALGLIKNHLSPDGILLLLVAITLPLLLIVNNLDTPYVRGLWSKFIENETDESFAAESFELEQILIEESTPNDVAKDQIDVDRVLAEEQRVKDYLLNVLLSVHSGGEKLKGTFKQAYEYLHIIYSSNDKKALSLAVAWHKRLLLSSNPEDRKLGLALCEILGLRCFDRILDEFILNESREDLKEIARLVRRTNKLLSRYHLVGLSFLAQAKFRFLFGKYVHFDKKAELKGLRNLIKLKNKNIAEVYLHSLFSSRYKPIRPILVQALREGKKTLNTKVFIDALLTQSFHNTVLLQEFLSILPGKSFQTEISSFLAKSCDELYDANFNIWNPNLNNNLFLSTLFLEHWIWNNSKTSSRMMSSIPSLLTLNEDQKLMLSRVHLEHLKPSPRFGYWQSFMTAT